MPRKADAGSFCQDFENLGSRVVFEVNHLGLKGAPDAFVEHIEELGVVAEQDGHVVFRRTTDEIENVLVLVLVREKVHFVEDDDGLPMVPFAEPLPELVQGATPRLDAQERGEELEAGVVTSTVDVDALQIGSARAVGQDI